MQSNIIGYKYTLSNQTVQVHVVGALKTEVSSADVVDSFIINHEGAVGVLKRGMSGEDGVVWLYNGGGGLRSWVNAEFQLDLLAEVDGQTFHEKSTKTRSSSTTERMEDEKTLETSAVISDMADLVQNLVNQLLSNGVVAASIVV